MPSSSGFGPGPAASGGSCARRPAPGLLEEDDYSRYWVARRGRHVGARRGPARGEPCRRGHTRGVPRTPPSDCVRLDLEAAALERSEEHTSELQSLMRISYAVFCLKNKKTHKQLI